MGYKIGLISDTHDNVKNIKKAVKLFLKNNVDLVIHCGDFVAPHSVYYFKDVEKMVAVKGNNDGDTKHLKKALNELFGIQALPLQLFLTINKKKIAVAHGHHASKLQNLIDSKDYDYIFTGHTHKIRDERIGKSRIINPGSHYYRTTNTVGVIDIDNNRLKIFKL